MRSEFALNYKKYFMKKKMKKLPARIRYKGWFLLKILEQRKVRNLYGNITLTRLKNIYKKLLKTNSNFFLNFLKTLEYRLDVLVYKLNLFTTIKYCQYLIKKKYILVNKLHKNLNYIVKIDDVIKILSTKKTNTKYILHFIYKDLYYNVLKQVSGMYLYRFLLNLNIFQNLKQVYFYIKKGFISVNNVIIKFPRYKLAFNQTRITIKNLGVKKKLKFKIKCHLNLQKNYNKKIYYLNTFIQLKYYKNYIYYNLNFYNYKKLFNKNINNNLLNNFLNTKIKNYNYSFNYWEILKEKNKNFSNINKTLFVLTYKNPIILKQKVLKNIKLKKRLIINSNNFKFLYSIRKQNLFIFKLKKRLYFLNQNNIYFNKKFKRRKLHKKVYKFSTVINKKFVLKYNYLKKYSLTKIQHLEINYKINHAILLKYFNMNSISSKDLVYLGIVSYYFFQYT